MNALDDGEPVTARIPADVEAPDKILYGLTVRQLLVVAVTGLLVAWVWVVASPWLPLPMLAAVLLPIVACGAVVAVGRRDGLSLDRYAAAALAHLLTPKARVAAAPGSITRPPAWCRMRGQLPAPLRLPVRAVRADGVLQLADGGTAALVEAGTVAFALRSNTEQAALVAAFGRWLNSLDAPVQILIQARPLDLSALAATISEAADHLPDAALARAACGHADFLADLHHGGELLTRRALLVLRHGQPRPGHLRARRMSGGRTREAGAAVVTRQADEAVRALTVLGITARRLDGDACTAVLAESLSPPGPHLPTGADLAHPDDIITTEVEARS